MLAKEVDLPHKSLAGRLGCTPAALSIELRLLLRFHLVERQMRDNRVHWVRPSHHDDCPEHLAMLNDWLYEVLASSSDEDVARDRLHDLVFASATVFTCPRRTALLRLLHQAGGSMPLPELRVRLKMSFPTLAHHLDKLVRRKIVRLHHPAGHRHSVCTLCLHKAPPLLQALYGLVMFAQRQEEPRPPSSPPVNFLSPVAIDDFPPHDESVHDDTSHNQLE